MHHQEPPTWSPDDVAFVVLTHAGDVHYARALLASIRYFYPSHHVKVLVDGDLPSAHVRAPANCEIIRTGRLASEYGLPLTGVLSKLVLLYLSDYAYYAYFDADSLMISPLFSHPDFGSHAGFYAIHGHSLDLTNDESLSLFKRYAIDPDLVRFSVDPTFSMTEVKYFSGGHFVMARGAIPPSMFEDNLAEISNCYEKDKVFHFNDQSFLNWAVNSLEFRGELSASIADLGVYGWRTELDEPELTLEAVLSRSIRSKALIHYTGPSRHLKLRDHNFSEILLHFHHDLYANRFPGTQQFDELMRILVQQRRRVAQGLRWRVQRARKVAARRP